MNRASTSSFESGYDNLLAELFELDVDSTLSDVPTAAILAQRLSHRKPLNEDHWLRAVPVNLIPDRDRLLLYPADKDTNTAAEKFNQQIVDVLLQNFDDLFADILVDDQFGWLFRLKKPARICTSSVRQASGNNIHAFLPKGDQAKQWIAVFNEIQMILHAADSAEHGFNAFWFEGVGSLPQIRSAQKIASIGNDNLFQAIAGYCQAERYNGTADLEDWPKNLDGLIVSDMTVLQAIDEQSEELLQQSIRTANIQFSQVLSLLDEGRLSEINLYLLNGCKYSIGKAGVLNFLKRRKKLSDLF